MAHDSKENKPAPAADGAEDRKEMTLIIKSQNNGELAFKVKPHTSFKRVAGAWSKNQGVDMTAVRFMDDAGERIVLDRTIAELGLEFEPSDEGPLVAYVDAFLQQLGGGRDR